MEDAKLAILTDAKQEYSHHLATVLKTPLYKGLKSLYQEAEIVCQKENRPNEVLSEFQELLSQVRLWSQEMIDGEFKRISEDSGCDFIKELVTAVFMSHTQILQFVRQGEKGQTKLDIPKPEHFIHKCYINSAREFWKDPIWFYEHRQMSPNELKRNIREAENIISNCVNDTIRELLPFRRILKTYLKDAYNEDELDEQEKNEPMSDGLSKTYQNNLREIIKSEIANYTTQKESSENEIKNLIDQELKVPEDDEVIVAETSPKTLTKKVNAELKEIKDHQVKELDEEYLDLDSKKVKDVADDFVESVPDISLDEIASLADQDDSDSDSEPEMDLEIDLEEVKTPQPGDNLAFDFNEVDLNMTEKPKVQPLQLEKPNETSKEIFKETSKEIPVVDLKEELLDTLSEAKSEVKPNIEVKPKVEVKETPKVELKEEVEHPDVKSVNLEPEKKEVQKIQDLVVEKEDNPLKNVTELPSSQSQVFDPNFDLDGEINLWEDTELKPRPKVVGEKDDLIVEAHPLIEETKPMTDLGRKQFKFFSRT